MTLKQIIEKCSGLKISEQRCDEDEYKEFVIETKEVEGFNAVLTDILGEPAKGPGVKPTKDQLQLIKEYGGLRNNQTLFVKEFDAEKIIVMFWPWEDEVHVTVKMAVVKR